MDKIFHSTFDFFTHAIPGFGVIAALLIFNCDFSNINDLIKFSNGINIGGGIFLLAVSYITGFAIHPLGRFLYKKLGFRIWKKPILNDIDMFISDKYIMIRELSPTNFKYVETWNMFCAMAHNFAVSSLVLFGVCILKIIMCKVSVFSFWGFIMIIALSSFLIFLHRAVIFSVWAAHDLNATISRLNLVEKAKNFGKEVKTVENK